MQTGTAVTTARALLSAFPAAPWAVPTSTISAGRYLLRFARTEADLEPVLRLRYQVFNGELKQGLDSAHATGRDEDRFDRHVHHLLVEERESGEVVGTYRLQTYEMAAETGSACARLFQLESLPDLTRRRAVEIGRGCIARPHRSGRVLNLLWRGLANYLAWNHKTVVFGCCSLTSQDQALGLTVHRHLEQIGAEHPAIHVEPSPRASCGAGGYLPATEVVPPPKIPALFQASLTMGARILGPPAIDREFKTIDWLVLLDVTELDPFTYQAFFK
jgi:putative hemolysin